jgi:hypothetical protein
MTQSLSDPRGALSAAAGPRESAAVRIDDAVFVICGLTWGSGLIHVVAAFEHVAEYALFAAFFALLAPAQFAWGASLYRRPRPRVLVAGAVASLVVVALWAVSRTAGLPIGPTPWVPEPVGALDLIATGDELVAAALALLHLRPAGGGRLERGCRRVAVAAGVCLVLASSLVLVSGGVSHVH